MADAVSAQKADYDISDSVVTGTPHFSSRYASTRPIYMAGVSRSAFPALHSTD